MRCAAAVEQRLYLRITERAHIARGLRRALDIWRAVDQVRLGRPIQCRAQMPQLGVERAGLAAAGFPPGEALMM